jgi:excisionase family DNA binding protein
MALWRVEEAADFLGIRPKTLYEWVRQGRVPYRKIGFNVRFEPAELESWVAAQSRGPEPAEGSESPSAGQLAARSELGSRARRGLLEEECEILSLVKKAAATLRALEREVGAELSFKRRRDLSALAERLEKAGRDPTESE